MNGALEVWTLGNPSFTEGNVMRIYLLGFLPILVFSSGAGSQEVHRVLAQPDAPVSVRRYEPEPMSFGPEIGDQVHHEVRVRNDSDRVVVAVKIGVLTYDVFNEFMESAEDIFVVDLLPGMRKSHYMRTYHEDSSHFLTGLTYIVKVRFQDGEIWEASEAGLDAGIQAFEAELRERATASEPGGGADPNAHGQGGESSAYLTLLPT
jgi:hypothetical protein